MSVGLHVQRVEALICGRTDARSAGWELGGSLVGEGLLRIEDKDGVVSPCKLRYRCKVPSEVLGDTNERNSGAPSFFVYKDRFAGYTTNMSVTLSWLSDWSMGSRVAVGGSCVKYEFRAVVIFTVTH